MIIDSMSLPVMRDSRVRWEIVWIVLSVLIAVSINLYTGASLFDLTLAHLAIAGIVAIAPTALLFGVVEAWVFVRQLTRAPFTGRR